MRVADWKLFVILALIVSGASCGQEATGRQDVLDQGPEHRVRDIDAYIARLERPDRAKWQMPDKVVAALALKRGDRVADVGAGSGYFTLPIARAVGPEGTVWAIDVEPRMLDHLAKRLDVEQLKNVRRVLTPEDDPKLPAGGVDMVFIVNTYHHFPDRVAYARKLRAALAPGGRLVNIDFVPKSREERGFGPPADHLLSQETADTEMAQAGLKPIRRHDFLPEQYFVEYSAE